jgi:hypothetical protein
MKYILRSRIPNLFYETMKLITQAHQVKQYYFASSKENVARVYKPINLQLL